MCVMCQLLSNAEFHFLNGWLCFVVVESLKCCWPDFCFDVVRKKSTSLIIHVVSVSGNGLERSMLSCEQTVLIIIIIIIVSCC